MQPAGWDRIQDAGCWLPVSDCYCPQPTASLLCARPGWLWTTTVCTKAPCTQHAACKGPINAVAQRLPAHSAPKVSAQQHAQRHAASWPGECRLLCAGCLWVSVHAHSHHRPGWLCSWIRTLGQAAHSAPKVLCEPLEWHAACLPKAMQAAVCRLPLGQCPCSQPTCSALTRLAVFMRTDIEADCAQRSKGALCSTGVACRLLMQDDECRPPLVSVHAHSRPAQCGPGWLCASTQRLPAHSAPKVSAQQCSSMQPAGQAYAGCCVQAASESVSMLTASADQAGCVRGLRH